MNACGWTGLANPAPELGSLRDKYYEITTEVGYVISSLSPNPGAKT